MMMDVFDKRWSMWHLIRNLGKKVYIRHMSLDKWDYTMYVFESVNQYKQVGEGVQYLGQAWDSGYTYFFKRTVQIPSELKDKELYLNCHIGGEGQVYVNGVCKGSLDTAHDTVIIKEASEEESNFEIEIRATKNVHDYIRHERTFNVPYPTHVFNVVDLVSVNKDLRKLYYLAKNLFDVVINVEDENLSKNLYKIIQKHLFELDDEAEDNLLESQAKSIYNNLIQDIHEMNIPYVYGKMYFVGHSHLDLAFKWDKKHTIRKVERTFTNTLEVLKRHKKAVMTQSQMEIFDICKRYYPSLYEKTKELVKAGRIECVGDMWTEIDANMTSGEGIIRHILYGRDFAESEFHTRSKVCFLPDTFGFSALLPQILKEGGFEYFVTTKLIWNNQNFFPHNIFLWEGIDGTSIKSYLMPRGYGGDVNCESIKENYDKAQINKEGNIHLIQYGMGDGGGGINDDMILSKEAFREVEGIVEVEDATMEEALQGIFQSKPNLPIYKGELYLEKHQGVYTSQGLIKKLNRQAEIALYNGEYCDALGYLKNKSSQKDKLKKSWQKVMFNHFHDILSGSCVKEAIEEAHRDYKEAIEEVDDIVEQGLKVYNLSNKGLTLMNTLGWKRPIYITVKTTLSSLKVLQEAQISYQVIKEEVDGIITLIYLQKLEGLSSIYLPIEIIGIYKENVYSEIPLATEQVLENDKVCITFDEAGDMVSIQDKELNKEVLEGKGNFLEAFFERAGYFDSWDISEDYEERQYPIYNVKQMYLAEDGPIRKTYIIERKFRKSKIKQYISLLKGQNQIDIFTKLNMQDKHFIIKVGFETAIKAKEASYDLSMGTLRRPTKALAKEDKAKYEVSFHKFMDLSSEDYGVALLNDSKYGGDVKEGTMRLTLVKTSDFPDKEQDLGEHTFSYSLYLHKGISITDVTKRANEYNNQGICIKGKLEHIEPLVRENEDTQVILSSVKVGLKEEALFFRYYEAEGKSQEVEITLPAAKEVYASTLMEETREKLELENQTLKLSFKPYEIKTIKVTV